MSVLDMSLLCMPAKRGNLDVPCAVAAGVEAWGVLVWSRRFWFWGRLGCFICTLHMCWHLDRIGRRE